STLLLPCLRPRDVEVRLTLDAAEGERLDLSVNGRPIGEWRPDRAALVPAALLFRGDNVLTLHGRPGAARLRAVTYAPAAGPSPSGAADPGAQGRARPAAM